MEILVGEHGETLIYGIIGIVLVSLICIVCNGKWKALAPLYKTEISRSNQGFVEDTKGKYPVIESDDTIYADYKDTSFVLKDYLKAKDCTGKDISDSIKVYGALDLLRKGVYRMKCVVKASNNLTCTKYVNVVVE